MKGKSRIIISCLILAAMMTTAIPRIPIAYADGTFLKLVSDVTELGPENAVGQEFTVTCVMENVTNLYGVDIQFGWDTEWIGYVSHTAKIPVETYPDGILHEPPAGMWVHNDVDETGGLVDQGAEPGTFYWLAYASIYPATSFNGSGIAFNMTFVVKKHPVYFDSHIYINLTSSTLADKGGFSIIHERVNAHILLHGRSQPAGPTISVSSINYKGSVPYTFDVNVSILNLDPYWDLGGYDIKLTYSPEIIQATNIIIDPDNWFNSSWPGGLFIVKNETDNTMGKVCVVLIGIPGENGTHTELYGNATLFTVTFTANASVPIVKIEDPYSLAAFPHPERPEPPFSNLPSSVPIPYNTTDGFANIIGVTEHLLLGYTIITESNSAVSSIYFEPEIPMLLFNVTGADGYTGYCNVTVPKDFMWSTIENGWYVLVDGQMVTPVITEDADNTYIYFTYQDGKHKIAIITTSVIPEFGWTTITILMLSAIALAVMMKKLTTKNK